MAWEIRSGFRTRDTEVAIVLGQFGSRVLLVDDDPLIRKLISRYLLAAGYVVRTVVDGLDALGKLRAGLPDFIISDLNMPRMSGLELLEVVRVCFPQILVIVISSEAPGEMPVTFAPGAFCNKDGFRFEQLPETIANLTTKLHRRTACPPIDNLVLVRCVWPPLQLAEPLRQVFVHFGPEVILKSS